MEAPAPSQAGAAPQRPPAITLLALTMGVFLVTLNVTVVTVTLPDIQRSLHARPDELEWVIDAYNLVGASLLLSAGFFADRFGRKRALCTGYSVFAAGALLCALAPSAGWLIAFRVLQAVGGTALTPTSLSIVANLYRDPLERARAIGIWGIASGVGLGAGPIVGGAVSDWMGWRAVFVVNAVAGVIALVIAIRVVPRSRSEVARGLDVRGQVLAAVLLATLTYALIEAPRYGWSSPRITFLLAGDVVLAGVFAAVELRVREPLIDLRVFRDRQFTGAIFITVAAFFAYSGFIYFTALYLQQVRGLSALEAGLVMLPGALPVLVLGPVSGRLVATRGARGVLFTGTVTLALGTALLALPDHTAPLWQILVPALIVGIGYGFINAPVSTVAVATLPRQQAGVAAATASSARNVGLVLGIAVLGSVVNGRFPGLRAHESFAVAYTNAIHPAYLIAAGVALTAAGVALVTLRTEPPGTPHPVSASATYEGAG
jgi:EmrB/QacA subfamily drug resistance transporter